METQLPAVYFAPHSCLFNSSFCRDFGLVGEFFLDFHISQVKIVMLFFCGHYPLTQLFLSDCYHYLLFFSTTEQTSGGPSIPSIQYTYMFEQSKPFYGNLKQTKADQVILRQTKTY